eukprot:8853706-Alexandrium_andersonii.AAC.1
MRACVRAGLPACLPAYGRAACAPGLDGFSWDELNRKCAPESAESECSDGQQTRVRKNTRVHWADMEGAHEEAQSLTLSDVC